MVFFTERTKMEHEININELKELEQKQNDDRGVSCVKSIIICLERGDTETAKVVYLNEWDKIRQYPDIQDWLYRNFGCRCHFKVDCQNEICKIIKGYNDARLKK